MDLSVSKLSEEWGKKESKLSKKEWKSLTYKYGSDVDKKKSIAQALAFWSFVQKRMDKIDWKSRRIFLSSFIADDNYYLSIVALIESLPTTVWTKLRHRYNMDYVSSEYFFCRNKTAQFEKIKEVYNDLIVLQKVPKVFRLLYRLVNRPTVDNLLKEELNEGKRYMSNVSMSYNLFWMGLGHSAYPKKGNNNITGFKPLRFLPTGEKAEQFVINKEDGIFWWMFKILRSNYLYGKNKEVEIGDKICLPFVSTVFLHLAIWSSFIVSAITFTTNSYAEMSTLRLLFEIFFGSIIPLWCLASSVKCLFSILFPKKLRDSVSKFFYEKIETPISDFAKSKNKKVEWIKNTFVTFSLIYVMIFVLGAIINTLSEPFGFVNTITTIALFGVYFTYAIYHSIVNDNYPKFKDFSNWVKIPLLFLIASIFCRFAFTYRLLLLSSFFTCLSFVMNNWFLFFVVLFPFLFILPFYLFSQKKMDKFFDLIEFSYIYLFLLFSIGASIGTTAVATAYSQNFNPLTLFLIIFIPIAFCSYVVYSRLLLNSSLIKENIAIFEKCKFAYGKTLITPLARSVSKNKWLKTLSVDEREREINNILSTICPFLYSLEDELFLPKIFNFIDRNRYNKIDEILKNRFFCNKIGSLLYKIARGHNFEKIRNTKRRKKQKSDSRRQFTKKCFSKISWVFKLFTPIAKPLVVVIIFTTKIMMFFILIIKNVGIIISEIFERLIASKNIAIKLTKMCPDIFQSKNIGMK